MRTRLDAKDHMLDRLLGLQITIEGQHRPKEQSAQLDSFSICDFCILAALELEIAISS